MYKVYIYSSLIMAYILFMFTGNEKIHLLVGILANLALIVSLSQARGLYLYSGIIFYLLGIILFVTKVQVHYFYSFDSMMGILALFIVLPFLNGVILIDQYDQHLNKLLQYKVNNMGDLFKRGSIVAHILGLFLNIATVPILLSSLKNSLEALPKKAVKPYLGRVILRAYAFCLMWSPMEIMIIQILQITDLTYITMAPLLLGLVAIFFLIHLGIGYRTYKGYELAATTEEVEITHSMKKIKELAFLLVLLVATVTLLDVWIQKGYLFSLVLTIIPISFLWAIKSKSISRYRKAVIPLWSQHVQGLANFFFMFISAGFFVNMISNTDLPSRIEPYVLPLTGYSALFFFFIFIFFFISSMIGFHPLVSMVILAELLKPILVDIHAIPLALVLIVATVSTVTYSPFHASTSILSNELRINPYQIVTWNFGYYLIMLVLTVLVSIALQHILI